MTHAGDKATAAPEHKHVVISRRLVLVNIASSVLVRLLNIFGLLWMYQYILKRIPTEEFAVYPVLAAIIVIAPLFFSFLTGGISRYVVAAYAKGEFDQVSQIVSSILPMLIAVSALFIATGLSFAYFIDDIINVAPGMVGEARLMLSILVVSFAVQMIFLPFGAGFHVKQRFVELNILDVFRDVFRLSLLVTLLVGVSPSVVWIVVASGAADMLHLVIKTRRSRALVPQLRFDSTRITWATAKELLSFGLWTTVGRLALMMYTSAGTIILNGYGTAVDVTNYYLGATSFQHILGMIAFARQPAQPALVALHSLDDRGRLARASTAGGRYAVWASMFVACPLAIYASDIVNLLIGDDFAEAATVLTLFMMILPFTQPVNLLPMIAIATGQVRVFNVAAFVSTAVCLALMVAFSVLLDAGAVGVTFALWVVTAAAQLLFFWPLNLRLSGISFRQFFHDVLAPGFAPAFVGSAVWMLLDFVWTTDDVIVLGAAWSVGCAVYCGVLFGFCLTCDDRDLVRQVWLRWSRQDV